MSFENDNDLAAEVLGSRVSEAPAARPAGAAEDEAAAALSFVPVTLNGGSYAKSRASALLLRRIGGGAVLHGLLNAFYDKMFQDTHLDQFVRSHDDPHASRLANWIIEKMGGEGDVWTSERVARARCPIAVHLSGRGEHVVHDRTTAHVAAWFSPKRPRDVLGEHFKLHDARVWMRLMFWACREQGLFEDPVFESWFVRFIAHFVRVYERMAPYFARDSARWSIDPENIKTYVANGNKMPVQVLGSDGRGVSVREAIKQVPPREINDEVWPYNRID